MQIKIPGNRSKGYNLLADNVFWSYAASSFALLWVQGLQCVILDEANKFDSSANIWEDCALKKKLGR